MGWGRIVSAAALAAPSLASASPQALSGYWNGKPVEARSDAALRAAMVSVHAGTRAARGLPPLEWDESLARDAAAYAATLAAARRFEHAPRLAGEPVEGENLWMGTRGAFRYAEMGGAWAEEGRVFAPGVFPDISRTGSWHEVGHYTQMIWAETRRFGCALAPSADDEYLVCRYFPAGNVMGRDPLGGATRLASSR